MTRVGIGSHELKKARFWKLMCSETLGSMIIVMLSSLVVSRHDNYNVILTFSLVSGLTYTVVLFIFGTHGYFNPAIAVSLFLAERIPLLRMLLYIFFQLLGAVLAQLVVGYVMLDSWYSVYGPGAVMPARGVSNAELFAVELMGSALLSAVISVHSRHQSGECRQEQYRCLVIGAAVVLLQSVMFPFSMGCMNPARSLSSHIVAARFPKYSWVYCVSPVVGAVFGRMVVVLMEKIKIKPADIIDNVNLLGEED